MGFGGADPRLRVPTLRDPTRDRRLSSVVGPPSDCPAPPPQDTLIDMLPDCRIIPADEPHLRPAAELAARLVQLHHDLDPLRFAVLSSDVAGGYERWFRQCIANPNAVVLVALAGQRVIGYAYGSLEPRNWNELLDACGVLHDVYVDERFRRTGVGAALVEEAARRLAALGAPRVVLKTAAANEAAQRLFARLGFRQTMIEMTREL